MREIGVVKSFKEVGKIKWFGGFNNQTGQINDYGFVECQGKGDIWVHRTEIYCSESDLKEGTLVKFELRIYGNGYRASNLHLLNFSEEKDSDIIECCFNHNIYLNECWGCSEIIDSRESRYQSPEKNYYICIHCGSGTQHSNTYTQGDICSKCGTIGMEVSPYNKRYRKCHSCNHSIKLPEERKITGSNCPQCRTQGMMLTVNQKNKQVRVCRSDSCRYSISAT